ncbi:MAG: hypothetical protein KJ650_03435 [Firmicutes bacterium]|jgi:hypothetical protein|nr:hypothetical protein [Bacillota bacterium]MBV1728407.1 hypothetical protein [Desulforudis sp.]MBV1735339.1 hypothetical protein [Desulforudis sp.]
MAKGELYLPKSSEVFLSHREQQLLYFIRQLGWGDVRIRIENGQPVVIYEAIKTLKLDDASIDRSSKNALDSRASKA